MDIAEHLDAFGLGGPLDVDRHVVGVSSVMLCVGGSHSEAKAHVKVPGTARSVYPQDSVDRANGRSSSNSSRPSTTPVSRCLTLCCINPKRHLVGRKRACIELYAPRHATPRRSAWVGVGIVVGVGVPTIRYDAICSSTTLLRRLGVGQLRRDVITLVNNLQFCTACGSRIAGMDGKGAEQS